MKLTFQIFIGGVLAKKINTAKQFKSAYVFFRILCADKLSMMLEINLKLFWQLMFSLWIVSLLN